MVRLILDSSMGSYPVLIGTNIHRELRSVVSRLDPTGVAIVTDTNVRPWAAKVDKTIKRAGLKTSILTVPAGERSNIFSERTARHLSAKDAASPDMPAPRITMRGLSLGAAAVCAACDTDFLAAAYIALGRRC